MAVILGDRLRQARELRRQTQTQLGDDVGVTQPTIARIENGTLQPSDELADVIALRTGFPKAFFRKPRRVALPEGSLLLYRKKASMKSADEAFLHEMASTALEVLEHLSAKFRPAPLSLPQLIDEDAATAATLVRSAIGVEPDVPIPGLVKRLESHGVVCLALPCEQIETFDAFSAWVERQPVIVMNPFRSPDRIRLTLSHELDHLVRRRSVQGTLKEIETDAFRFAAEFLMPGRAMRRELVPPITITGLAQLKLRWGVSVAALARRAKDLSLVSDNQYKYLNIKIRKMGWHKAEPGSQRLRPERPRALRKMFEMSYGTNFRGCAEATALPPALLQSIIEAHATVSDMQEVLAVPRIARGKIVRFRR